jgi:hypothetical protein
MLERAAASLAYYKGYVMRGAGKWPELEAWFDAMESRPTYLGTKSDHYTHCHDLPPQLGGEAPWGWCRGGVGGGRDLFHHTHRCAMQLQLQQLGVVGGAVWSVPWQTWWNGA